LPDKNLPPPPNPALSRFQLFVFLLVLSITALITLLIWVAFNGQEHTGNAAPAGILYLSWDENEHNQLFFINPAGGATRQLTTVPFGIFDYTVGQEKGQVVFSSLREDGGSDLYALDPHNPDDVEMILTCGGDLCSGPVWNPAGNLLIYERRPLSAPNTPPGEPRLWWLEPATGETIAVFNDAQWLGHGAGFSADGAWLSYIAPQFQEIHAYNRQSGQIVVIASQSGEPAAWHPTDNVMLTSQIQPQGEAFATHLFRVEIPSAEVTNLSNEVAVNDGTASFSPDGALILFGRKVARAPMGRQLWVMQPDGSDPVRLTHEFNYHHGLPSWASDGERVLMQRFNIEENNGLPGVWVLDVAGGTLTEIITPGIQPKWLPE
jgi:Tol biopolymer transport system component